MRVTAYIAAVLAVTITSLTTTTASAQTQTDAIRPTNQIIVASGDTLSKIASAHQTTYQRLFDANLDVLHPDLIYVGQTIRIPSADEQILSRSTVQPAESIPVDPAQAPTPHAVANPAPSPAPTVATGSVWDRLAQCEAGGNWAINTGNGFYGGLQFTLSSWQAAGGSGFPHETSREEQIARGEILLGMQGWGAWPACSAKLGLR